VTTVIQRMEMAVLHLAQLNQDSLVPEAISKALMSAKSSAVSESTLAM
jgi:hypothetical protein